MKKVAICLFISFLISGFFLLYHFTTIRNDKEKNNMDNKIIFESISDSIIKENLENEPITEIFKDDVSDNQNITDTNVSSSKNNMESNNVRNNNVVKKKENKKETKKEETKEIKQEEKTEPIVNDDLSEQKEEINQPVIDKPKTAWEELGISEYDYYNKPMWSWARVDYKVEDYGSFDKTHQACIDDGNKLDDIISFACTNINSFSGDYLGDMLRVKK